jgi:hypothetical protein
MKNLYSELLKGHGKVNSEFYIRVVNGKSYMSQMPLKGRRTGAVPQKECTRFKEATLYAITIPANPALLELYKAKASGFNSAYTMAIADFMKPPVIGTVAYRKYHGRPGDAIRIRVKNIIRVKMVSVTVIDPEGIQVEAGDAFPAGSGWVYQVVNLNNTLRGTVLQIKVQDFPGNLVTREIEL